VKVLAVRAGAASGMRRLAGSAPAVPATPAPRDRSR